MGRDERRGCDGEWTLDMFHPGINANDGLPVMWSLWISILSFANKHAYVQKKYCKKREKRHKMKSHWLLLNAIVWNVIDKLIITIIHSHTTQNNHSFSFQLVPFFIAVFVITFFIIVFFFGMKFICIVLRYGFLPYTVFVFSRSTFGSLFLSLFFFPISSVSSRLPWSMPTTKAKGSAVVTRL